MIIINNSTLNKVQMSMLKMSTKMLISGRKRFVNFLRSQQSYNLTIVCKMIVWSRRNFFVKEFFQFVDGLGLDGLIRLKTFYRFSPLSVKLQFFYCMQNYRMIKAKLFCQKLLLMQSTMRSRRSKTWFVGNTNLKIILTWSL